MAKNLLQQHFPMIPTRMEVEKLIYASPILHATFISRNEDQQKEFLDFCTGERGVKILYDKMLIPLFSSSVPPWNSTNFRRNTYIILLRNLIQDWS